MRLTMTEFLQRFPHHDVARELLSGKRQKQQKHSTATRQEHAGEKRCVAGESKLERIFAQQLHLARLPCAQREYKFHPERKWKMDFAWPQILVAVEVEGGVWKQGRHTRPKGFIDDTEKYNTAAQMGWVVLRFAAPQIHSGEALTKTEAVIQSRQHIASRPCCEFTLPRAVKPRH